MQSEESKVICIGWHKTGTTTMGDALAILGYNVTGARLDLAENLLQGKIDSAINVAQNFDALQDVPWAALYKELDCEFPNSKFILTVRNEKSWLLSAQKHFKSKHTKMREYLYGTGSIDGNEDIYLKRYQKHYSEVKEYFKDRPEDIITMDFKNGDGWNKLCKFLDQPIPKKSFPHSNKGKHNYNIKDKIREQLRKILPAWLKEWRLDILVKLGYPDKRNRFNNKEFNVKEMQKYQNLNN